MKRAYRVFTVVSLLLSLILTVGCPQSSYAAEMLSIGTHGTGTNAYIMGSGAATAATTHSSYDVRAIATSGPNEWMPMITTKEMDMGVLNSWEAHMAWLGKSDFDRLSGGKGFPVRSLFCAGFATMSALVPGDSDIYTAADLKGKNYVLNFTGSAGQTAQSKAFLANHNISESDVVAISVPGTQQGIQALTEGRADVTGTANTGMAVVEELNATRGARFLNYDPSPEAAARALAEFFGYIELIQPAPGLTGVVEPTYMYIYEHYLVAREDLSEDAAYAVVKATYENYADYAPIHPRLEEMKPERFVSERATVPYHPGAIKYYKEAGVWTDRMDALQEELLALKDN